jgi:hypothetical protein
MATGGRWPGPISADQRRPGRTEFRIAQQKTICYHSAALESYGT